MQITRKRRFQVLPFSLKPIVRRVNHRMAVRMLSFVFQRAMYNALRIRIAPQVLVLGSYKSFEFNFDRRGIMSLVDRRPV